MSSDHGQKADDTEQEANYPERVQARQVKASRRGFLAAGGATIGLSGLSRHRQPVKQSRRKTANRHMTRQMETVSLETAKQVDRKSVV